MVRFSQNKALWIIFLTIFIDMLGIGILIPVFPLLITHGSEFRVTPLDWSQAESFIFAGWLLAVFPILQFFCTPILGQLSDKYGRRKLLILSISGTAVSYLLFAYGILTRNIELLFFSRMLDGASGGNISIAQAVIGDVSAAKDRAKNFGLVGVSIGLGFVLGPFIGGKLSDPALFIAFNAATPFWFAGALSFVNLMLVYSYLPETSSLKSTLKIDYNKPLHNIFKSFMIPNLRKIIPALFLYNAGFTFFTTFWGIILLNQFDFTQGMVGNYFAYLGLMIIFAQGGVVRRLSGKVTDYKVLYFSFALTAVCLFAYYLIPNHAAHIWIYCIPPFLAIATALSKAFSSALIARTTDPSVLGEAMGVNSSTNALAQAIPSLLAGYVAAHQARLTVLLGALLVILAGIYFARNYRECDTFIENTKVKK
ncbi:MAG: MFS transporter [Neisseriaceae bacterium]|nr:MAG: MFS transporter [Neisseriaceae bacterium]